MNTRIIETPTATLRMEEDGIMRQAPVWVDMRGIKSADREARAYLAGAEAMIVESAVSSVIMNFFVNVNKPPLPVRIFTDEVEALKWLKGYL